MTPYNIAKKVVQKIVHKGFIAYFAGGFVRDKLLGHPSDDIDIATDASVEEITSLFPRTIPVGINFGIVIVVEEGHQFEVATFRKESGHTDGRRPDRIERASPEEDAQRRDFTINGMFYDPLEDRLHDYVGGQEDLKKKVVRAIGDPHERFFEDRLRMIRAVRYAARFHFTIDEGTKEAILIHAKDLFPSVAIERVMQEFKKMSLFSNFSGALVTLHQMRLLGQIFPSLDPLTIEEIQEMLKHLPNLLKETPLIGKLLELFPKSSLKEQMALCDRLRLSNEEKKFVEERHRWLEEKKRDDYDWVELYAGPHAVICLTIAAIHRHDHHFQEHHLQKMKALTAEIERRKAGATLVTSKHLLEKGIEPGVKMGQLLKEAERIAVNHRLTSPAAVLQKLVL